MARGTVNKVIILGRLGQDPEVRATASGMQVATLNVATNELGSKDATGNRQADVTEWHRCVVWNRLAENAAAYLRKGSMVYLEGRLQTRKWQDQTGNDRYSTEIMCNEMQFVGGRAEQQGGSNMAPSYGAPTSPAQPAQPQTPAPAPNFDDFDDDIPI